MLAHWLPGDCTSPASPCLARRFPTARKAPANTTQQFTASSPTQKAPIGIVLQRRAHWKSPSAYIFERHTFPPKSQPSRAVSEAEPTIPTTKKRPWSTKAPRKAPQKPPNRLRERHATVLLGLKYIFSLQKLGIEIVRRPNMVKLNLKLPKAPGEAEIDQSPNQGPTNKQTMHVPAKQRKNTKSKKQGEKDAAFNARRQLPKPAAKRASTRTRKPTEAAIEARLAENVFHQQSDDVQMSGVNGAYDPSTAEQQADETLDDVDDDDALLADALECLSENEDGAAVGAMNEMDAATQMLFPPQRVVNLVLERPKSCPNLGADTALSTYIDSINTNVWQWYTFFSNVQKTNIQKELPMVMEPDPYEPDKEHAHLYTAMELVQLYLLSYHHLDWHTCDLIMDIWIRACKAAGIWKKKPRTMYYPAKKTRRENENPALDLSDNGPLTLDASVTSLQPLPLNTLYTHTDPRAPVRFFWADAIALGGQQRLDKMMELGRDSWHPDLLFNIMHTCMRSMRIHLTLICEEDDPESWCLKYHEHRREGQFCYRELERKQAELERKQAELERKQAELERKQAEQQQAEDRGKKRRKRSKSKDGKKRKSVSFLTAASG